jgi:hypothetical protein
VAGFGEGQRKADDHFGESLGKAGWGKVFKDALFEFNKLSSSEKLGVTFEETTDRKAANVEAEAERGNFEFQYLPDIPKETIKFSGTDVHGFCRALPTQVTSKAHVPEYRLLKAFIYVPASPTGDRGGSPSVVGDPVKLVIAVHEMIHACGLVNDNQHSVDDIFCWPRLRMGSTPSDDRLQALGGTFTYPGLPGKPPRIGHGAVDMPPIFLKSQTAEKVRKLWA